jgi:hypothetical protein
MIQATLRTQQIVPAAPEAGIAGYDSGPPSFITFFKLGDFERARLLKFARATSA